MPTSLPEHEPRGDACLTAELVTAGYSVPVIHNVSVSLCPGEMVCILGPNGAGKSTLLKAVVGALTPTEGRVTLFGEDVTGLRADQIARRGVGYVPQTRDVFGPLTVEENLEMGGYLLSRREVTERMDEVFALFPVLASMRRRVAADMSGGERKMLGIGRVLMTHPRLLLLDEPTAGLSPQMAHVLLETHVIQLAQQGTAVLFVEQRAIEALSVADWAYMMISGDVIESAPAKDLLGRADIGDFFLGREIKTAS